MKTGSFTPTLLNPALLKKIAGGNNHNFQYQPPPVNNPFAISITGNSYPPYPYQVNATINVTPNVAITGSIGGNAEQPITNAGISVKAPF